VACDAAGTSARTFVLPAPKDARFSPGIVIRSGALDSDTLETQIGQSQLNQQATHGTNVPSRGRYRAAIWGSMRPDGIASLRRRERNGAYGVYGMIELKFTTPFSWVRGVVESMDAFLPDHAAAEKKASSMAMGMIAHYPDRRELVNAMMDLALEELSHFRAVVKLMNDRGLILQPDEKDAYVNALRNAIRNGQDHYFLDRLLVAAIVEARGAERFGMIADALPAGPLKRFYRSITRSEAEHQDLFVRLADRYFEPGEVRVRLDELLTREAGIVRELPIRVALH
jgi:tRNA-(ms[2]io[6]A)-hydroxylase